MTLCEQLRRCFNQREASSTLRTRSVTLSAFRILHSPGPPRLPQPDRALRRSLTSTAFGDGLQRGRHGLLPSLRVSGMARHAKACANLRCSPLPLAVTTDQTDGVLRRLRAANCSLRKYSARTRYRGAPDLSQPCGSSYPASMSPPALVTLNFSSEPALRSSVSFMRRPRFQPLS